MVKTPMVSVVLPVYNGEPFVLDAIRSIQEQTLTDWELIILDDGSTDRSLEICQDCAAHDPRIRVYSNSINIGLAKTMNKLVRLGRGKYIAVQEQDDISMPKRLKLEVEILEKYPEVGLVSGVAAWLDDEGEIFEYYPGSLLQGEPFPSSKHDMITELYKQGCKVVNSASIFRRSIVDLIPGPLDEKARIPDRQFFIDVAHLYQIFGINHVLVKMKRGRDHKSITSNKALFCYESLRCINIIYGKYKNNVNSPINYNLYCKAKARQLIYNSRFSSRSSKLANLILAIYYDPLNYKSWSSMGNFLCKSIEKHIKYFF